MHRFLGRWAIATLLVGVTNCGTTGSAPVTNSPDPGICIAWEPDTSVDCPAVDEITAAVHDTLGHRPASRGSSRGACATQITGAFRPDRASGWTAELHFEGQSGESLGDRFLEIHDAPCSALKEPLALVIALMAGGKSSESTAVRVPNPPSPRPQAARPNMTAIAIGGAVSSGLTADLGLGASLGVRSRAVAGLPLRLETTFWFPTTPAASGPTGRFWAWVGAAGFCPSLFEWKRLAVSACARVVAGVVRGAGRGLDENADAARPVAAGAVGAHVALQVSRRAALYLGVGAAAPWLRPRFVYRDPGDAVVPVHQPGVVIPLAEVGIELGASQARRPSAAREEGASWP